MHLFTQKNLPRAGQLNQGRQILQQVVQAFHTQSFHNTGLRLFPQRKRLCQCATTFSTQFDNPHTAVVTLYNFH